MPTLPVRDDYSTAWKTVTTNANGFKKNYYYNAFQQLTKIEELDDSQQVYSTTNYSDDFLGNLAQTTDTNNNNCSMFYNWLSQKTQMIHPDMGSWR